MPAAAVIPASAASIKVAAVKRLAVECQCQALDRWTLGREIPAVLVVFSIPHGLLGPRLSLSQAPVRDKPPRLCT